MHEAAYASEILSLTKEILSSDPEFKEKRLISITLELEKPYIISPESLELYFEVLIEETPYKGTKLLFVDKIPEQEAEQLSFTPTSLTIKNIVVE